MTNQTIVLLTEIAALNNLLGTTTVRAFAPKSISKFQSLPKEVQMARLELLKVQYMIFKLEALNSGKAGVGLWRFCKDQNLSTNPEMYSYIDSDSSVQILDLEDKHMYCNDVFYALTSHSLEDLVSLPFHELFHRNDELDARYQDIIEGLKAGEHRLVEAPLPIHKLTEANCERPKVLIYRMRKLAPVFQKDQLVGVVSISDAYHE